ALAAPIWNRFMKVALKGTPPLPFVPPPGITLAETSTDGTPPILEAFKPGQVPGAGTVVPGAGAAGPVANAAPPAAPGAAAGPGAPAGSGAAAAGGIDSGLGGLY
ncbi:MAG: penicillin-binding protein 1A, partial [Acetobacteraceae bacterium]